MGNPSFKISDHDKSKYTKLKNMAANGTPAEKRNAQAALKRMFLKLPGV